MAEKNTRHIYTVSKLTREIKSLLESSYPFVWVAGEISNYAVPVSGHAYFTLKDQDAVINCVVFKNQRFNLKFEPENGIKIMGLARLTLYEPRGSYQLIFEHLEPEGAGSLQLAFEQLKNKLSAKGFFDAQFKKPIPFLPNKVNFITSLTGAAIQDIITVSQRRFANCRLEIVPVKVQGEGAELEICNAIELINTFQRSDVIILARGGGSLEDLSAFNSESVATAVFNSKIPVVTGVGHETDFTIADFVSDLRAPTPSAAAELVLPDKKNLIKSVIQLQERLNGSAVKNVVYLKQKIQDLSNRLKSPKTLVYDFQFRLEDCTARISNYINHYIQSANDKVHWLRNALIYQNPAKSISAYRKEVISLMNRLDHQVKNRIQGAKTHHIHLTSKLSALNPQSVLQRGYSISRSLSDKRVITDSTQVKKNDLVEIILSKGQLVTKVEKING